MKKREPKKKNNYKDYSYMDVRYKQLVDAGISYSEENKPVTEKEKAEAMLLLLGPEKMKALFRIYEESGKDSIDFGEVLKVAEEMEAEREKTKELMEKITSLEENRSDINKEEEPND